MIVYKTDFRLIQVPGIECESNYLYIPFFATTKSKNIQETYL